MMNTILRCVAASVLFLSMGSAAFAARYEFSPAKTTFTATGPFDLEVGSRKYDCVVSVRGKVKGSGRASLTAANFSGSGCNRITATQLPWTLTAGKRNRGEINGLSFMSDKFTCTFAAISFIDEDGSFVFKRLFSGNCILAGGISTSPAILIVPKT